MVRNSVLLFPVITFIVGAVFVVTEQLVGSPPTPQLQLPCKITEVYDGDTVTVEVTLKARVRLLDCWAPELRDTGGKASRDNLKPYEGKEAILQIPLEGVDRLDDVLTFGRILGNIYVEDVSLSEEQVGKGFATKKKSN